MYLSVWDLFWAVSSPLVAFFLRDSDMILDRVDWSMILQYWGISASFALIAFFAFRLQDGMTRHFSLQQALDISEAVLIAQLMTCAVLFSLTRLDGIPRSLPLIHGLVLGVGLLAARLFVRIASSGDDDGDHDFRRRNERVIVIGSNRFAAAFIQLLRAYAPQQEPVIAVLDDDAAMVGRAVSGVQVLGAPHELDAIVREFAVHGIKTDRIVIAGEANVLRPAVRDEVERICQSHEIALSYLPRMIGITEWSPISPAKNMHVSSDVTAYHLRPYFRLKRWMDVLGSIALIILLSPVMLIAAALVSMDVGLPVLFWQERVGWKGRSFLIYKFRTLRAPFDSSGNPAQEARRASLIGRFLRATRIDELPQLFNVLFGDMSMIGPRPLLPEDQPSNSSLRLAVRPGISGWAQVHGAKLVSKEDKEKLDEWYVRNASVGADLRIVVMTIGLLLRSRTLSAEIAADADQVKSKDLKLEHAAATASTPNEQTPLKGF
jgi:lipopolysaccharide/colanic/teichoic acid biosynthesis glycosyltransferase